MDVNRKKTIEKVIMNIISIGIGILLALYFLSSTGSSSQDNHFLGGLVIFFEFLIKITVAIVFFVLPITLAI